jgi:formate hydrogenlyase subunit 6/NADH:ubiquinone oxidoreductase subunit I
MRILTMLWKNFWGVSRTLLFPARPKVTQRFRGLVQFDPELCSGCAICKFRCTSRAITYQAGKGEFTWGYDPGQCTFCGRCVEGCTEHALKEGHTEHALSQESACPPIYLQEGELKKVYTVKRKAPAPKPATPVAPKVTAAIPESSTGGAQ